MNDINKKRRQEDDSLDITQLSKRFKSDIIIQKPIENKNLPDKLQQNESTKLEKIKPLKTLNLKHRYKYYCKKHNATYLVQNARKIAREYWIQNRNSVIENYRSSHESANLAKEASSRGDGNAKDEQAEEQFDSGIVEPEDTIKADIVEAQSVNSKGLKRKFDDDAVSSDNTEKNKMLKLCAPDERFNNVGAIAESNRNEEESNVTSDTDEESECFGDYAQEFLEKFNILRKTNVRKGVKMNGVVIDDSEDSDEDFDKLPHSVWKSRVLRSAPFDKGEESDYSTETNSFITKRKTVDHYCAKKFAGKTDAVSLCETEDLVTNSEYDDCDCSNYERRLNDADDDSVFKYDSSIDTGSED